ncbi:MAG: hypothetical protein E3J60_02580 [Dehalococcoidia bacterium]|nr:MAG: hypothetical protein E3J60_02580 [Dehalococcoidia bacterium]
MKRKSTLDQPDMFGDVELIKPKAGTDAGIQVDMFNGKHVYSSDPTEQVNEAATILKQANRGGS